MLCQDNYSEISGSKNNVFTCVLRVPLRVHSAIDRARTVTARSEDALMEWFGVLVEPIDYCLVPELAILRFENPMAFVGKLH